MRVLIVFDKFKGSLGALQACELAARALRADHRDWELDLCPLTDGGDGFAAILTRAAGGRLVTQQVTGPRGGWVEATLGLVPFSRLPSAARTLLELPASADARPVAVVEMAAASGLERLPPGQHDPWQSTSLGTGQLIRAAAEMGAGAILLGVGGSATNDLGAGALAALGVEFRTADGGRILPPVPALWPRIARIEEGVYPSIPPIRIACDVVNPLLGPRGAAAIYGPQKGLLSGDLARMEAAMARLASMLCARWEQTPALVETPGAGAAGGLPFGLLVAAGARLLPGVDLVSAWLDLPARIAAADVVITGEGTFDQSSLAGKGPGAVALLADAAGRAVHVFAGRIAEIAPRAAWRLHAITPAGIPLEQALREAPDRLARSVRREFAPSA